MSDSKSNLPVRPSLEQLQKQAKELLRQYRAGEETFRNRFAAAARFDTAEARSASLADAQFVLAREYGFETWASLKRHVEAAQPLHIEPYEKLAEDVVRACQTGDADAVERLGELFGGRLTIESIRNRVSLRLSTEPGHVFSTDSISLDDARLFVARLYSFGTWTELETSFARSSTRFGPSAHGLSAGPPFYRIDWKENSIELRPPISRKEWDEIFEVMRHNRITNLRAGGQMTDVVLERLAQLDLVTSLHLDGSRHITDAGLKQLARIPRLKRLNLSGCSITDQGLTVLRQLPELREFYLYHHSGISDEGLANLRSCEKLERVDLLGSNAGDGTIRALTGKPRLRHFKSGDQVTDEGLPLLHHFPVFKTWQGGDPGDSLRTYQPAPNLLLLRGEITDKGMQRLQGLDGLFALNLDDSRLSISAAGLRTLAELAHLGWLGFDATDETMGPIAELPRLRNLMCQDTRAGDAGFTKLSRSRTIEYIWGRRCYNLTGVGFAAMAHMPSLRGLSVSCKNVDDAALSTLPDFPALVEFMPMDVPDEGFRHVGRCDRLEVVRCMYCRDTGDAATGHLARLPRLKTYYAGQTRITDRSLELLGGMQSLERLSLEACAGVTNAGIAFLATLPRLQELSLALMSGVTREAIASFPAHVRVSFES